VDLQWRKSSYSSGEGENGNCIEVALWQKSSYSSGDGENGNCVEVAVATTSVAVRDSKAPTSGTLVIPASAWPAFLNHSSSK